MDVNTGAGAAGSMPLFSQTLLERAVMVGLCLALF